MIYFGHPFVRTRRAYMLDKQNQSVPVDFKQFVFPVYCDYDAGVIGPTDEYSAGVIESYTQDGRLPVVRVAQGQYEVHHGDGSRTELTWEEEPQDIVKWLNSRETQ